MVDGRCYYVALIVATAAWTMAPGEAKREHHADDGRA